MGIASGNRMCSVASWSCSVSLSCKSLYCSLHMSSSVDDFVFYIHLAKKISYALYSKYRLFLVQLKLSCSGKNLFCCCNWRKQHLKSYWVSVPLQLKIKTRVTTLDSSVLWKCVICICVNFPPIPPPPFAISSCSRSYRNKLVKWSLFYLPHLLQMSSFRVD